MMKSVTISHNGQVTIPNHIRDQLGLVAGDTLTIHIDEQNRIILERGSVDFWELNGMLATPESKAVSVEKMDAHIATEIQRGL